MVGYLKGVPFWWTAEHMFLPWLLVVGLLVAVFTVIDTLDHRRQPRHHEDDAGPQVNIVGAHNFLFIGVILLSLMLLSQALEGVSPADAAESLVVAVPSVFAHRLLIRRLSQLRPALSYIQYQ